MTAQCTIHNTQMYQSKFEPSKFYHYIGGDKANGSCYGEGLGKAVRNGRADDITTEQATYGSRVETKIEEKVDWDAKDRQSMAQTAMKSASEIVAALIASNDRGWDYSAAAGVVEEMANKFFKELVKIKSST